eukprot:TRINITY_DN5119_c0_g1_i2.p1 TRINITY_DN5119_c0_g1~~TRINITY_DN5119_c0_g1_i2.p1  ORF type:complete len:464 (-),score=77.32 TRINITY_DN5119_c0_g1_i2:58-1287(-)
MATKFNAVNLGPGFPNWRPQQSVLDHLESTVTPTCDALLHQYARSEGHLNLVKVLAKQYSSFLGRNIDPLNEVVVTVGASSGICTTLKALISPGDEVILIEPFYDMYYSAVIIAQGVIRTISLKPKKQYITSSSDFVLDLDELKSLMNEKTKLLLLNTPHNPSGKVFTEEELKGIADVVCQHPRCVVVTDEVYEHLTYDNVKHVRFASLPGMYERTVTISSIGKTFSITGWKIGWVIAPAPISSAISRTNQYISFCVSTPLQEACSLLLEATNAEQYDTIKIDYQKKRDLLYKVLVDCGFNPILPQGAFFIVVDVSQIHLKDNEGRDENKSISKLNFDFNDWSVCRWLTSDFGVTAIPCSTFYDTKNASKPESQRFIRFAFCKDDESLQKGAEALIRLKEVLEERRINK